MAEPKPCPNCSSDLLELVCGRFEYEAHLIQVVCLDCGVSGPFDDIRKHAWLKWDAMPRAVEQEADHA